MLRFLLLFLAGGLSALVSAQNVGISTNGAIPDPNAILDVDASSSAAKRGLLIPRMTEAQRLAIPVTAADNALLVYQTDLGAAADASNARGLWYWDQPGNTWVHLSNARRAWLLNGNTLAGTEYLGTTTPATNRPLVFRTGPAPANPAMQMGWGVQDNQSGYVALGTPAPATERLEIQGAMRMAPNAPYTNPPLEGTIRYGTIDGSPESPTNPKWHWGTVVKAGTPGWARLENAEQLVLNKPYAKDTLTCQGGLGTVTKGQLSSPAVTQPVLTNPANVYSPFATNAPLVGNESDFRVQYLYRYEELLQAGLCFPATINAFAFFSLDQENLADPANSNHPATISGEIRGGAPDATSSLTGPSAYFGLNNSPPFMANNIQLTLPKGSFNNLNVGPGWINFLLTTPITLNPGDNLILDIVWTKNKSKGVGPRVELEDPGFHCTKWVLRATPSGLGTNRYQLDDYPLGPPPTADITFTPTINPHSKRPVTRFTGTVATPDVVQRNANYLQYAGAVAVGDAAWLASLADKGPGTVRAQNGVYDGNIRLSDHVFDQYFDGRTRPADAGAAQGYAYVGLAALREKLEQDRHLPNMPSRQQWEAQGGASLGSLTTGLWQSVEDQALYISQLEQDLSALEELAFGSRPAPEEAAKLRTEIQDSKRLTEAQKIHLLEVLDHKANPQAAKP